MRRYALAIVTAASLGLVACSSSDEPKSTTAGTITAAESAPENEESTEDEGAAGELNKPLRISTLSDNDVFMTIKEISLGKECRFGVDDPEYSFDQMNDDQQYLQILAEIDVQKLDNPVSGGSVYLDNPKAVDGDGFAKEAELGFDCEQSEGYEDWGEGTEVGDKSRRYGAFIVPKGVTEVRIQGKKFAVEPEGN